ncbi:MAG TPA: M48 family metalloprotease, partial [Candidatus Thermoplasmatota archaeon]|nr:M48 family metalloprotease [Candidatus Thermoplasmatota archaeon]
MSVANNLRAMALISVLLGLFAVIGYLVGWFFFGNPNVGLVLFLVLALAMNFASFFWADKIVLRMYRARVVDAASAPRLYRVVQDIAQRTNMPMPRVAIIPDDSLNAFATGRNPKNAVVAATRGILQALDDDELEGVMAHEMGHVINRDILVMGIAATVASAISFAASSATWGMIFGGGNRQGGNIWLLLIIAITAPIAAMMVQLAISRGREFGADATGARVSGKPLSLARALQKLERHNNRHPMEIGSPASAHLFIVRPFRGGGMVH